MFNRWVKVRHERTKDADKFDKHDLFMIKYMGIDWYEEQQRKAETIFISWQGGENLSDKNFQ